MVVACWTYCQLTVGYCIPTGIGGKLWDSCLILTRHLSRHRDLLVGKTVVELGSGLGLVGIFCSLLGAHVTLTDIEVLYCIF